MTNLYQSTDKLSTLSTTVRYPAQVEILKKATQGDQESIETTLMYLSSEIENLRFLMQSAIHDWPHTRLWHHLLHCLGYHHWQIGDKATGLPYSRRDDPHAVLLLDNSIIDVFTNDESSAEKSAKETVLRLGLARPEAVVRHASAYLLGLRNDPSSLPFLEKVIQFGEKRWKIRAIQALEVLNRAECAAILVMGVAERDLDIHRASTHALESLGRKALPALAITLEHPEPHVRWHAARLLGAAGDPHAVHVLAGGLSDPDETVRWASATSLAALGKQAVPEIMDVIRTHELTETLRQAIYHALHAMPAACREKLRPLIEALSSPVTSGQAPAIASRLMLEVKC